MLFAVPIKCDNPDIYKMFTQVWLKSVLPIDAATWTVWTQNIKTLKSTKPSISLWKRRQSMGLQLLTLSINTVRAAWKICVLTCLKTRCYMEIYYYRQVIKVHVYDTLVSRYCVKHIRGII